MIGGVLRFLWDWVSGEEPAWVYGQHLVIGDETFQVATMTSEGFILAGADFDAFLPASASEDAWRTAEATEDGFIAATVSGEVFN